METPWVSPSSITPNLPVALLASPFSQDSQRESRAASSLKIPASRPSPNPSPPPPPALFPQKYNPLALLSPSSLFSPKQNYPPPRPPPQLAEGPPIGPSLVTLWGGVHFGLFQIQGKTRFLLSSSHVSHGAKTLTLYPYPIEK